MVVEQFRLFPEQISEIAAQLVRISRTKFNFGEADDGLVCGHRIMNTTRNRSAKSSKTLRILVETDAIKYQIQYRLQVILQTAK